MKERCLKHDGNGVSQPKIDWRAQLQEHDRWLRTVVSARLRSGFGDASGLGNMDGSVDDVMQEVALAAVRQQAPIDDPAKAAPWLYGLAVRQALLYRRQRGRQKKLLERVVARRTAEDGSSHEPDPLRWLLDEERREAVRRALHELPARDAEVLLLKYTENWKYQEIAAHLGMSVSAVEARLFRARRKLRSVLSKREIVSLD